MIMNKTSNFWKLFKKDNNPQDAKDVIQNPSQTETEPVNREEECSTAEKENDPDSKENKMNNSKARIYNLIIVDESGSMSHLRKATLSGINETIGTIRSAQEEFFSTQEHTMTLLLIMNILHQQHLKIMN